VVFVPYPEGNLCKRGFLKTEGDVGHFLKEQGGIFRFFIPAFNHHFD
jgi:hypothetical protein